MAQKRKKGKPGNSGGGGGGGIFGMRQGFRRMVGAEKGAVKKKVSPFWNAVSWIAVVALVALTAFVLYRRFGG
jgi:uncharacterized membrane protein